MFGNISQSIWQYSLKYLRTFPECLTTFPGIFDYISWNVWLNSRNVWLHSPDFLATFSGKFEDIPRNIQLHFSQCLAIFPNFLAIFSGVFSDIPQNVWGHFLELLATFLEILHSFHSLYFPHSVPRSCFPGFMHSPYKLSTILFIKPIITFFWQRVKVLIKKDIWTLKNMILSGKYITNVVSIKKHFLGEYSFKFVCFCESC